MPWSWRSAPRAGLRVACAPPHPALACRSRGQGNNTCCRNAGRLHRRCVHHPGRNRARQPRTRVAAACAGRVTCSAMPSGRTSRMAFWVLRQRVQKVANCPPPFDGLALRHSGVGVTCGGTPSMVSTPPAWCPASTSHQPERVLGGDPQTSVGLGIYPLIDGHHRRGCNRLPQDPPCVRQRWLRQRRPARLRRRTGREPQTWQCAETRFRRQRGQAVARMSG